MEHLASIDFYRDDIDGRTILAMDANDADPDMIGRGESFTEALRDLRAMQLARRVARG